MKTLKQSTTLILATIFVFITLNTPLSDFITQILALLIIFSIIFVVIQRRRNKGLPAGRQGDELFIGSLREVFVITAGIVLTVFLTGGIQSNLFFLLYFLLFGIAFLFEPVTVFVFLLGFAAVFIQPALKDDVLSNLIKIGSLGFLSPIAFFFGREFKRREKLEKEVEDKTGEIIEDVDSLLHSDHVENDDEEVEELSDILEKTQKLRDETEK
ncbi:MAG: hypothetical protein COX79_02165 [Candidatus Levybacteria bacterium CG_4_10_14_0_2_um_filter_36_16]|nr:MAG: hypothetical protein AUK12_02410 [Candidatus Levybacteria bacterium CG2_30_37_29]PIR79326.1 MAG: hypothetical protein COU26_01755 [Candidatus Levybacteria bacterium CG10_big_fil_rev_8_21_14_0_10_36_30]PIZ97533.1 MAG: hypothetical protein COX79_02165 [Candidatus Levybacteria bacterium CG_4_10_14_0_2_um_filter_36_16]